MKLPTLLFLMFYLSQSLYAQLKYEKEYRISSDEVAQEALDFFSVLHTKFRIKWFREESIDRNSLEAKFKHSGNSYSVEFNEEGEIEDIEVTIELSDIPAEVQQKITTYLNSHFLKHKLCKVQRQYSGDRASLQNLLSSNTKDDSGTQLIKYELVVKVRTDEGRKELEMLFDSIGELESQSRIVEKNTDNLEF